MSDDYRMIVPASGGPEVIEREAIMVAEPGPGEVRIRQAAIGLNFIDAYHRSGLYRVPLPTGLGMEGAGTVEAVGEDVTHVRPGDRVAYSGGPLGAYASARIMPAAPLIRLPDSIDFETAAAALLKGMTADMLVGPCGKVKQGQTVLVQAASGGVGSILVQWLKTIDVRVIAHAGTEAKAARAKQAGADEALSCSFDLIAQEVCALTDGRGVDVVFDGVGAASWAGSLASAAKFGLVISYGNASGPVPPVSPLDLGRAGSLFMTRPTLFDYHADPKEMHASAARLFAMIENGKVRVEIGQRFPLAAAGDAHRAMEGRTTTGSTLLMP